MVFISVKKKKKKKLRCIRKVHPFFLASPKWWQHKRDRKWHHLQRYLGKSPTNTWLFSCGMAWLGALIEYSKFWSKIANANPPSKQREVEGRSFFFDVMKALVMFKGNVFGTHLRQKWTKSADEEANRNKPQRKSEQNRRRRMSEATGGMMTKRHDTEDTERWWLLADKEAKIHEAWLDGSVMSSTSKSRKCLQSGELGNRKAKRSGRFGSAVKTQLTHLLTSSILAFKYTYSDGSKRRPNCSWFWKMHSVSFSTAIWTFELRLTYSAKLLDTSSTFSSTSESLRLMSTRQSLYEIGRPTYLCFQIWTQLPNSFRMVSVSWGAKCDGWLLEWPLLWHEAASSTMDGFIIDGAFDSILWFTIANNNVEVVQWEHLFFFNSTKRNKMQLIRKELVNIILV